MTCPACGARNADSAAWCSQCLRPLGDATPDRAPRAAPAPSAPAAPAAGATPTDRAFRTVDGEVEWRCPDCQAWNVFLVPVCARCGHRLGGRDGDHTDRTRRALWAVAAVVGVVVVIAIVLVVLALGDAPAADPGVVGARSSPGAVVAGGLASTATSCPPATCGDP